MASLILQVYARPCGLVGSVRLLDVGLGEALLDPHLFYVVVAWISTRSAGRLLHPIHVLQRLSFREAKEPHRGGAEAAAAAAPAAATSSTKKFWPLFPDILAIFPYLQRGNYGIFSDPVWAVLIVLIFPFSWKMLKKSLLFTRSVTCEFLASSL